ncbi:MAG: cupredoxin domain-containing protein [Candidatus Limnocylindrales bacterium]
MIASRLVLAPLLVVLVACSTGGTVGPTPSAAATRIDVTLTDALRIEPATMTVPAGVPVTFVVTNAGAIDHEFYLGDEAAQAEHESEMQSTDGMMHDDPRGISLDPGQTMELTFTFAEAGATLAGCHVAGHYPGGMRAAITVAAP